MSSTIFSIAVGRCALGWAASVVLAIVMSDDKTKVEYDERIFEPDWVTLLRQAEDADPLTAQHMRAMAEQLRERAGPPDLCIEDGVDAEYVAYLKERDSGVITDEQGRVVELHVGAFDDTPPLREILGRLAPLRHVKVTSIVEGHHNRPTERLTDDGLQAIAGWTEVESLEINTLELTGESFLRLTRRNPLKRLRVFTVNFVKDADQLLKAIQDCTELRELDVSYCEVTDAGLPHLANLQGLEKLSLGSTKISGNDFRHLCALKQLRVLALDNSCVSDAGLAHLPCLAGLEELWLGGADLRISDAALDHIAELTELRKLSLGDTSVTGAGLEKLTALSHLETLFLDNTSIGDDSIPTLSHFQRLSLLTVGGTRITKRGLDKLRSALPNCQVDH